MDAVLAFFSDLILFTAGLGVVTFWLVVIVFIIDEGLDLIFNRTPSKEESNSE